MRSRIFCKKFKSLAFFILAAFLIVPSILTVVNFTTQTFADVDNNKNYTVKIYDSSGQTEIASSSFPGKNLFKNDGTNDVVLSYVITAAGSADANGKYADCELNKNMNCQLVIRTNGSVSAVVTIQAKDLSQITNGVRVQIVPDGVTCTLGSADNGCLEATIAPFISSSTGSFYNDNYGSGNTPTTTVPIATATQQYYDPTKEQTGSNPTGEQATCHSESGAVGWFICPILELAANASKWAYDTVIEPSLRIRSDLFNTTGDNTGTFQAWSVFRDVANIIFVILLLVVILSQLTGIGIDNYGIKKTLPNLIVAAILVNLSFIICQALVDVSNIVGAGTYNAVESISSGITVPNLGPGGKIAYDTSIIFTICATAAGIGAYAAAAGSFWTMISGALLAVLPAIIGAVVAILFLFFLLAMRQAIVVMLVAIAPLAFVCYTLPNTKKLFSRWSELLRAMLVLYPICALMIAGGRLASKIILASGAAEDNLFIILVAMVAEAGPLFLIPGLTRNAYRATGQLGATLNGLRGRWAGGLSQRVGNSNTVRYLNQQNQNARANNAIRRFQNRYNNGANIPTSRAGRLMYGIRNMGYQQAQGVTAATVKQYSGIYADSDKGAVNNELNDALKKLDPQRFVAAFRDLLQKGGREEALTALYSNPEAMNNVSMRAVIEREMGSSGDTFMKEYAKYRGNGGTGNFKTFIDDGHLTNQLNAKGETAIAGLDKDNYAFLSAVAQNNAGRTALRGLDAAAIARASTTLSASDQAAKFNKFLENMQYNDAEQEAIVQQISINQSATMFDSTRAALSSNAVGGDDVARVNARFNPQFSEMRSRPDVYAGTIAQMRNSDRENYMTNVPNPTPNPNPNPNTNPNPTNQIPPQDFADDGGL